MSDWIYMSLSAPRLARFRPYGLELEMLLQAPGFHALGFLDQ